ncbi:uncharacterized protein LOC117103007 [Anneissia japonica]|uniref:uncharacterized protein LOC117103007 n=1 Tax=Anneissia japonica TaxID=1529436 RepID=UPI001425BA24|nr:uncharacterized protein LOC117103007 [Anneissia japonica]
MISQNSVMKKGLMLDCGATSHIITEIDKFTYFDDAFDPSKHFMELADGRKMNNVALRRGNAEVFLQDIEGNCIKTTLKEALFIPHYPQSIFSVKAATMNGARVRFQDGQNELIHKDGTVFAIEEHERLYYLNTKQDRHNLGNREIPGRQFTLW